MAVQMKTEKKVKTTTAKKPVKSLFDEKPKQDDLAQLLADVKERPIVYGGIAAFLIVCLLAGFLWRASAVAKRKDEVIYMAAETAYKAGQYDKAKASFERLRNDFKSSTFTPDAVEGLGYIAENSKDYDAAATYYKEVQTAWSDSFAARRQPMNIARVEEQRGKFAEAIAAYNEQLQLFPGSSLEQEAKAALARLEKSNPELFPKAEPIVPALTTPVAPGAETPAAQVPVAPDTTVPSLDMQLKDPNLPSDTTSPAAPGEELDMKLKMPELGGTTTGPTDATPAKPADNDLGDLGEFEPNGSASSASTKR